LQVDFIQICVSASLSTAEPVDPSLAIARSDLKTMKQWHKEAKKRLKLMDELGKDRQSAEVQSAEEDVGHLEQYRNKAKSKMKRHKQRQNWFGGTSVILKEFRQAEGIANSWHSLTTNS
jgi:uncharacterized protein (DUF3084 family)